MLIDISTMEPISRGRLLRSGGQVQFQDCPSHVGEVVPPRHRSSRRVQQQRGTGHLRQRLGRLVKSVLGVPPFMEPVEQRGAKAVTTPPITVPTTVWIGLSSVTAATAAAAAAAPTTNAVGTRQEPLTPSV